MWSWWVVGLIEVAICLYIYPWSAHFGWWYANRIPGIDEAPVLISALTGDSNRLASPEFQPLDGGSTLDYKQLVQIATILYITQYYEPDPTPT